MCMCCTCVARKVTEYESMIPTVTKIIGTAASTLFAISERTEASNLKWTLSESACAWPPSARYAIAAFSHATTASYSAAAVLGSWYRVVITKVRALGSHTAGGCERRASLTPGRLTWSRPVAL